jgi:hypothetical protein
VSSGRAGAHFTTAVEDETALVLPPGFLAVTTTRSRRPLSAAASLRALAVAPAILAQRPPAGLQRCHWYLKVGAGLLDQRPLLALRVLPLLGVPEIVGFETFLGGARRRLSVWVSLLSAPAPTR